MYLLNVHLGWEHLLIDDQAGSCEILASKFWYLYTFKPFFYFDVVNHMFICVDIFSLWSWWWLLLIDSIHIVATYYWDYVNDPS